MVLSDDVGLLFKIFFVWLYNMLCECKFTIFGIELCLWDVCVYGVIGSLFVSVICIFLSKGGSPHGEE